MKELKGAIPAMITPFTADNKIDEEGFIQNIDFVIKGGVSGIVPCGTTGEAATMTSEEHKKIVELAVEHSKVPVIAGTGSNNTTEAIEYSIHAADSGADAILVITPYYNKPTQDGLIKHFELIANSADIPMVLYNVPSRTGVDMSIQTIAKLAKHPNIIGIKEATGSVSKATEIIKATAEDDFTLLSGDDIAALPLMAIGATGVISVAANIFPDKISQMINLFEAGDIKKAREIHYELAPIMKSLFVETNPGPVKTAARLMKMPAGPLRLPLVDLTPESLYILKRDLRSAGVNIE